MRAATKEEIAASAAVPGHGAVGEACRQAVDSLGSEASLVLAFASGELDYEASATELAEAAGGAATAGMTGKGLISAEGPLDHGCVAMAFAKQVRATVAASRDASGDLRAAGQACTSEALEALGDEADLVLLFIDSTRGDIADTVLGAYEAAGPAVPLAGGAAGGAEKHHFHSGETSSDSVVAVALASDGALGIGNTQSCRTRGAPSIVTRSEGQRVEEIDGRPAEEVYLEQLGFAGVAFDDEEFEVMAITHPLAQPELHGDFRLRHVLSRTGDGAITVSTHVPTSAVIEFTELDFDSLLASGAGSVKEAMGALGGASPRAALVFDCAGRIKPFRHLIVYPPMLRHIGREWQRRPDATNLAHA